MPKSNFDREIEKQKAAWRKKNPKAKAKEFVGSDEWSKVNNAIIQEYKSGRNEKKVKKYKKEERVKEGAEKGQSMLDAAERIAKKKYNYSVETKEKRKKKKVK